MAGKHLAYEEITSLTPVYCTGQFPPVHGVSSLRC